MHQQAVKNFYEKERPEYVFIAAAKVGGILANNTYRAQFIYENLQIQNNLIHFAYVYGVKKLFFLGSSCIYPKLAPQPIKEEYLLTGPLEPTNEPYAIAKIAGIKLCENYYKQYGDNFISVMPTNLYGPNDNFDLEKSHVLPALIRKIHLAKCLENGDWDAIRKNLNKRSIESVDGSADAEIILDLLKKCGIYCEKSAVSSKQSSVGNQQLAISHEQLPTADRQLLTDEDRLPTANRSLPPDNVQLPTADCQLTLWGTGQTQKRISPRG